MKPFLLLNGCLAATLILLSTAVYAADPTPTPAGKLTPDQAQLLKRYDANGDGKLDENERAAAKESMRERGDQIGERILQRFDANHDGKLTGVELDQAVAALAHRPRILKRFDKNGDGVLDDAEKAQLRAMLERRFGASGNVPPPAVTVPTPSPKPKS